jgi:lysophospholipase L1-like esterase
LKYTFSSQSASTYFRVTGYMAQKNKYMYIYADSMPNEFIPYTTKETLSNNVIVPFDTIDDISISKEDTDFIKIAPKNLCDLSKMVVGITNNSNSNGDIDSSVTNWRTTDFIPVEVGEVYTAQIYGGVYYGSGFKGVCAYDLDKNYLTHIIPSGGISISASTNTLTIPNNCAYIRLSYPKANVENPKTRYLTQVFKGDFWTAMYIPYDRKFRLQNIGLDYYISDEYNILFNKYAMWNGDSICAADNDSEGGWALRIANANGMYEKNYAIAGGCIAENVGSGVHSVSGTLDQMISDFPNSDYVIIEGGTNDADILGDNGIGTFDANDFSDSYIEGLNKETFSGALESIFYRLVTQMKTSHIGYLIPQKMGHTEILVTRRRTYFDRAIAIAQKWGVPVLDLWNNSFFNWRLSTHWDQTKTSTENEEAGNLYVDGQHLTTTGYSVQSPIIAEWMKTL